MKEEKRRKQGALVPPRDAAGDGCFHLRCRGRLSAGALPLVILLPLQGDTFLERYRQLVG